jgi:hypothetical protein
MMKRSGLILTAFAGVALAACSTASTANVSPAPSRPHPLAVPAVAPAGTEDYQSLHGTYRARVPAATTTPDSPSGLTARRDGRAPSVAKPSATPAEDFQSLHATYRHLPR